MRVESVRWNKDVWGHGYALIGEIVAFEGSKTKPKGAFKMIGEKSCIWGLGAFQILALPKRELMTNASIKFCLIFSRLELCLIFVRFKNFWNFPGFNKVLLFFRFKTLSYICLTFLIFSRLKTDLICQFSKDKFCFTGRRIFFLTLSRRWKFLQWSIICHNLPHSYFHNENIGHFLISAMKIMWQIYLAFSYLN